MTLRKRSLFLALLATVVALVMVPGVALAFDSVHGGYTMDTDACAGCHRAHTASSPITWIGADRNSDGIGDARSALLISTAETSDEFCYTCHGAAAVGADTNVWDGVFLSRDGVGGSDEVYNTSGEALNGGGFNPTMFPTQHYPGGATWMAWGAGNDGHDAPFSTGGEAVVISCTVCHDTHGSSNYRLLKDQVAGIDPATGAASSRPVGGYDGAGNPTPFVISAEQGAPAAGWPKGAARMTLYTTYFPDFTTPRYAKAPGNDPKKGISGWCQACHTQMNTAGDSGNVTDANDVYAADGTFVSRGDDGVGGGFQDYLAEVYDANDGFGLVERHRHPTNVSLSLYVGSSTLNMGGNGVPLAHDSFADSGVNASSDWIDCLSCHVAHGSAASMSGYASVADSTNPQPNTGTKSVTIDGTTVVTVGAVPPDYGNALLRTNNRGVCQACHNK